MIGERSVCNVCGTLFDAARDRLVEVRCNIRRFARETFDLWRCTRCRCIHCRQIVDLPRYYEGYGTKDQRLDFFSRLAYSRLSRRLRAAGLRPSHRLLDYGCGSGNLVMYLRQHGFDRAVGYDPYRPAESGESQAGSTRTDSASRRAPDSVASPAASGDPALLEAGAYDFVTLQDVIEHVEDPRELLARLAALLRPGGVLMVGTPSADEIVLEDTRKHLHQLHAPYHLHLYTRQALVDLGREAGLTAMATYRRYYAETPLFGMNEAFCRAYLSRLDDCIDSLVEPPRVGLILRSPVLLLHGLFGYWYSPRHSVTVMYRKGA